MPADTIIFEPGPAGPAAVAAVSGVTTATPSVCPAATESSEQEIARLTWAVLDGGASLADRQRLAALVNAQHAVRHRFDR